LIDDDDDDNDCDSDGDDGWSVQVIEKLKTKSISRQKTHRPPISDRSRHLLGMCLQINWITYSFPPVGKATNFVLVSLSGSRLLDAMPRYNSKLA